MLIAARKVRNRNIAACRLNIQFFYDFIRFAARFIANKASYQFKHREMDEMLEKLRAALAAKEEKK